MALSPLQELSFHPRCSILQILGPVIQIHKPISQNNLLMILWHTHEGSCLQNQLSKNSSLDSNNYGSTLFKIDNRIRAMISLQDWTPSCSQRCNSGVRMAHLFSKVLANIWASSMLVNITKRMISEASVTCKNMSKKLIEVCKRVMDREQDK